MDEFGMNLNIYQLHQDIAQKDLRNALLFMHFYGVK